MDNTYITEDSKDKFINALTDFSYDNITATNIPLTFVKEYKDTLNLCKSLNILLSDLIDVVYSYIVDKVFVKYEFIKREEQKYVIYSVALLTHESVINYELYVWLYDITIVQFNDNTFKFYVTTKGHYPEYHDSMTSWNLQTNQYNILKCDMVYNFNEYMKTQYNQRNYISLPINFKRHGHSIDWILNVTNHEQYETTIIIIKQIIDIILSLFA